MFRLIATWAAIPMVAAGVILPTIGYSQDASSRPQLLPDTVDQSIFSPDFSEGPPTKERTQHFGAKGTAAVGPVTPAGTQPRGALSGRIVFAECGHGWAWDADFGRWRLLRPVAQQMNEDYGNIDQLNMFATYCFNAGATVVGFRPLGNQTNLVILDNDDPGVSFSGTWSTSTSTIFWGTAGDVPYRWASLAATETATACYTPNLPKTDFYPVYTWVRHSEDRTDQLYRIRHTGGESQVRVPHHMVGNGWVYLGEYYFNAGSNAAIGSVVISNLRGSTNGSVVIADAIRFGNGMGSIVRGTSVSGYPAEDESARSCVASMVGVGQSASLYDGSGDDESDGWSAPPKMAAEMNRQASGNTFKRIYLGFHSNAGGGRGTVGLINGGGPTPNQTNWAQTVSQTVDADLQALGAPPLEYAWADLGSTYAGGYGEISASYFNGEMDATIVEVAFHDDATDAKLLRSVVARAAVAKASYHAVVKFMNKWDGLAIQYLPEPPVNVRAIAGSNGTISVSWNPPIPSGNSGAPTNYVVYLSTNGYGFGNPINVGIVTNYVYTNLAPEIDYYFRVAASNAGGESVPSETVGCRVSSGHAGLRVLVVNGFWRMDRLLDPRQDVTPGTWDPPGLNGAIDRVLPRKINSFDYVVQHGKAIAAANWAFDSCSRQAISNVLIRLTNYAAVVWYSGQQCTKFSAADRVFNSAEQVLIGTYLSQGGSLFVSGSELAYDLDRPSGPTSGDRNFFHNILHCSYGNDTNGGSYTFAPTSGGIFAGNSNGSIDNGNKSTYAVQTPDELLPYGTGASAALSYVGGGAKVAAVQHDGSTGNGKTVVLGFPFETITSASIRNVYMADALNFLMLPSVPVPPQNQTALKGEEASFAVTAAGVQPLYFQWRWNGLAIPGATASSYMVTNVQPEMAGLYSVQVSNVLGVALSSSALLTVHVPAVITSQPQGQRVSLGQPATFMVSAEGLSLNYQWRRNGVDLAGATDSSLTIPQVQFADRGSYSVVISNAAGGVTSSAAALEVCLPVNFDAPVLSVEGASLRISNQFGGNFDVEYSSNLVNWLPLTNVVGTNAAFELMDPARAGQRFYRGTAVVAP